MRLPRMRFTVRWLLVAVALSAVMMGAYVVLIESPARRQRFRRADQSFRQQIALLLRACEEEKQWEQDARALAAKDFESGVKESRMSEELPEATGGREYHRGLAVLWDKACREQLVVAGHSARRACAFQQRAEELLGLRQKAGDSIEGIERVAREGERLPETPVWVMYRLAHTLYSVKYRIRVEQSKDGGIGSLRMAKEEQ